MKFLPYQQRWINDNSRMKILEKSRRIGGTYSTSYDTFKRLMRNKHHDIVAVTRDENLGVEFVADVARWVRMWNAINQPSDEIPDKCIKRLSIEIPHDGGVSRLIAVSSNPNAAIGRGGSLILDEFAAHKDPELLMRLAQPIIMAGGSMSVLSTHRSRNSKFNELVIDSHKPDSQWSRHRTTIIDAVEQGLVEVVINPTMIKLGNDPWESREAFLEWLRATYDEYTFAQEFMCIPSDDACSLLSFDEVRQAIANYNEHGRLDDGVYFMGYDCAESVYGDFASYCVLRANHDNQVDIVEHHYFPRGTSISEQIDTVIRTARKWGVRKLVCDNNGIGRHPTTIIKERLGEHMVVAFDTTMHSKAEMCTKAKRYFQNGFVRMPDDKQVQDDFLSIDRVLTPAGNVVYQATRTGATGHGDMFMSMAMGLTEVPEVSRSQIKGVSAVKSDPLQAIAREYNDRVERNRRMDTKQNKKAY